MDTPTVSVSVAQAGLPGMVSLDLGPLIIPIERSVQKVRVYLVGKKVLKLRTIALSPRLAKGEAHALSSSRLVRGGKPKYALTGDQIQSAKAVNPWWEISFAEPRQLDKITILPGKAFDMTRLYSLRVEIDDELVFDNLGVLKCEQRIDEFRACVRAFTARAGKVRRALSDPAKSFAKDARALTEEVRKALTNPEVDVVALNARRLQCLSKLVAALKPVRGSELREVLTVAIPVLSFLISRGVRKAGDPGYTAETEASAILLAILLIRNPSKRVHNNTLRGFRKHFWSPEQLALLEKRVNNITRRALRRRANGPYLIRVHGLAGPNLAPNANRYLDHMESVQHALTEMQYDCFIAYGTLLGAVREGNFIAHDDDVDMAVVLKTNEPQTEMSVILKELRKRGFRGKMFRRPPLLDLRNRRNKFSIDLFPVIPGATEGTVQMYMEGMVVRPVPAALVIPTSQVEFLGRTYNAPASPVGFLVHRYGENWQTPMRKIAHTMMPVEE